jgi:hypothetical protein
VAFSFAGLGLQQLLSAPVQSREVFLGVANQEFRGSGLLSGSLAQFQALKMLFESQLGCENGSL